MQTFGFDGEPIQFLPEGDQDVGEFVVSSKKVFLGKGIIGRINTELHAKIKTCRRLSGARNTHNDDICLIVILGGDPVVISEGIIHGVDADIIAAIAYEAMVSSDGMRGFTVELLFQTTDEDFKEVKEFALTIHNDTAKLGINEGAENNGRESRLACLQIDLVYRPIRLGGGIDKGEGDLIKKDIVELGQETLPQGLRRDGCAVRYEKNCPSSCKHKIVIFKYRGRCDPRQL